MDAFAQTSAARGGSNLDASVRIGPANFWTDVPVRGLCGARFGRSDAERCGFRAFLKRWRKGGSLLCRRL